MHQLTAILIAAHLIADFGLQTDQMVQVKHRVGQLFLHAVVHAALTFLALQTWHAWQIPVTVFVIHAGTDFVKHRLGDDSARVFVIDQTAHVLALLLLAWLLARYDILTSFTGIWYKPILTVAGFIAAVRGAGFFVAKVAGRIKNQNNLELDGLTDGGKLIGELERALIFILIFIGQPTAIGFLVAAKSILRFEEAKKQKLAEYVIIGTLLSFSLAIAIAAATRWAIDL